MAMFTAYFDASGHPDDPGVEFLTVGGFLASADNWVFFDRCWKRVLNKYGFPDLHMRKYRRSMDPLIGDLIPVIQKLTRYSFACTISLDDYRTNDERYQIRKTASPIAIAGLMAMRHLRGVVEDMRQPWEQMSVIFEDGDADKGNLEKWARGHLGIGIRFENKKVTKAFEACDLIAWHHLQASRKLFPAPGMYGMEDMLSPFQELDEIPHSLNGKDSWSFIKNPELEESTKKMLASTRRPGVDRYPVTVF
jgi:hypothetical protein